MPGYPAVEAGKATRPSKAFAETGHVGVGGRTAQRRASPVRMCGMARVVTEVPEFRPSGG
jgi:hypothetical protein